MLAVGQRARRLLVVLVASWGGCNVLISQLSVEAAGLGVQLGPRELTGLGWESRGRRRCPQRHQGPLSCPSGERQGRRGCCWEAGPRLHLGEALRDSAHLPSVSSVSSLPPMADSVPPPLHAYLRVTHRTSACFLRMLCPLPVTLSLPDPHPVEPSRGLPPD